MNANNALQSLVTEAVALDREIAQKTERLKELKAALIVRASLHKEEFTKTQGGGSSWTATGTDGCIARVSFPAPTLKSEIKGEGKAIAQVKDLAGKLFSRLFIPSVVFKPIPNFREEAVASLEKSDAGKLIKLCESKSAPRVSFETAEHVQA